MNVLEFTFLVWAGSLIAGFLGALTGLGGGVVLVPLLTIFFHVDLRYAIGASLVSVIATSSGSAAAYVKEGFSNIRIGMFLEIATTLGALLGAYLTAKVPASAIAIIFGLMLVYSAYVSRRTRPRTDVGQAPDPLARVQELYTARDALYREVAELVVESDREQVSRLAHRLEQQLRAAARA